MCLKCPTTGLYVGETGQTLRQRMNSHRFNIKHGNTDAPVTVLKGNFETQQERKEWEFKLMRKFNTLECGLDRDRSFMSRYDFNLGI
ncbi:hypothetical protein XELAEV_18046549mg [Xenopus laevis]|uniref:GIY-YIG domain-containing protein n=1 Tax=Xenopus laevis TaxID=8355 RepID=A0A974BTY4_XENLA|nr:hypothetical protein XELAEV_18046549mg [Xenopus laevis]